LLVRYELVYTVFIIRITGVYSKLAAVIVCNSSDHEGNIQTRQSRSIYHAWGI